MLAQLLLACRCELGVRPVVVRGVQSSPPWRGSTDALLRHFVVLCSTCCAVCVCVCVCARCVTVCVCVFCVYSSAAYTTFFFQLVRCV
jgi:hypothetical protein